MSSSKQILKLNVEVKLGPIGFFSENEFRKNVKRALCGRKRFSNSSSPDGRPRFTCHWSCHCPVNYLGIPQGTTPGKRRNWAGTQAGFISRCFFSSVLIGAVRMQLNSAGSPADVEISTGCGSSFAAASQCCWVRDGEDPPTRRALSLRSQPVRGVPISGYKYLLGAFRSNGKAWDIPCACLKSKKKTSVSQQIFHDKGTEYLRCASNRPPLFSKPHSPRDAGTTAGQQFQNVHWVSKIAKTAVGSLSLVMVQKKRCVLFQVGGNQCDVFRTNGERNTGEVRKLWNKGKKDPVWWINAIKVVFHNRLEKRNGNKCPVNWHLL